MIVTCPACAARYQFDEERLEGRSAKITCPSCDHVFVTHPPKVEPTLSADTWPSEAMDEASASQVLADPSDIDIESADFSTVGVTWKVRQGLGLLRDFTTLRSLEDALEDGLVGRSDEFSYDGRHFVRIDSVDDLEAHFRDIWDKACKGEVRTEEIGQHFVIGGDADDEDEDAPTTIVRTGNALLADLDNGDELGHAPPPAASDVLSDDIPADGPPPLTVQPATVPAEDTEDLHTDTAPKQATAVPTPAVPKPTSEAKKRSVLPIVLLVIVVLAILGVILYQQGVFASLGG